MMQKENKMIPIIIPSLEPDERLVELLRQLKQAKMGPIVLVDDGSGPEYQSIFHLAQNEFDCILLRHAVNLGKGRALKTAFNYCLNTWPEAIGCVTADSDGQHSVECIQKCCDALNQNPDQLILGVRDFDQENVPSKSKIGNKITRVICKVLCGVSVSDTQTGLRALPSAFRKKMMNVQGERFEFETRMLIETKEFCRIKEIPIQTIYDSKENHATHFDPIRDSIRIYRIFGVVFGKFLFSSLSSSVLDLFLFSVFCGIFGSWWNSAGYVAIATVMARIISATYNYLINYRFVFQSKAAHSQAAWKYAVLALLQMLCSATLVTGIYMVLFWVPELCIKIPVDVCLFFVSYCIQREFVYKKSK